MNPGGVETWLMNVLRHIDRSRFRMDFLVHTAKSCAYDEEIRALGSTVITCLHPSRPRHYARNLSRVLHERGPYDVVHSHVHHFSGYVLRLARHAGVRIRIAHSHNDTSMVESKARLARRGYLALMKRWVHAHATVGLACSASAAADLYGPAWEDDPRWRTLYCGIDLSAYELPVVSENLRAELRIPAGAFVLGHVGRFVPQKNHAFVIHIAAEIMRRHPATYLLLVGDGPLRQSVMHQASATGIAERVVFAGIRSDVPRLMRGAMDVLLFPSIHEGLGLVLVEAQAAGLPCVFADIVPREAEVVQTLMRRQSLAQSPSVWADDVFALRESTRNVDRDEALRLVAASPFNIRTSLRLLERAYCA
jgi:glycosyltransferase involved in cell wall biosynthesis